MLQKISIAADLTFDERSPHVKLAWQQASIEKLADKARKIFRLHGAVHFSTPILSPNNGVGSADSGVVSLMTRSGNVTNLPYDLRLAFARYLAQNPDVRHTKRYTVEKVFRERRILGTHPKEVYECSLDIVGTCCGNESLVVLCWALSPRTC